MLEVELQSSLGAEVEVKKLQELVRRLEHQNEQLRNRAGPEETLKYFLAHSGGSQERREERSQPTLLDQLELLDLSSLSCWDECEETWLYASSKTRPVPQDSLTPLQWCRHVLDRPRSAADAIGGSPPLRPGTVVWGRGSIVCPAPFSPCLALLRESPLRTSCSTPQSSEKRHAPPLLRSPRHPTLQRKLSPIRRELLPSLGVGTPTPSRSGRVQRRPPSPQGSVDGGLGSDMDDSTVQAFKLQDLLDVQVMARLQEESLRQDLVRTSFAGLHSRSFGFLSGGSGLKEEDEDQDPERSFLPRWPRPLSTLLSHSGTFSSVRDFGAGSPPPPHSISSTKLLGTGGGAWWDPALGLRTKPELGSGLRLDAAGLRDFGPGLDALRRSMPNLSRVPSTAGVPTLARPGSSPRSLRGSQSFDSFAGLTRRQPSTLLQNRVNRPTCLAPAVGGSRSSANSNRRSSLPRPLASPGTSSTPHNRLSQSALSFLTPPKTLSPLRSRQDLGWRECSY